MQIASSVRGGGFAPTMQVDIYDRFEEMRQGDTVRIGQVMSDGSNGTLTVLDPRFARQLKNLFEEPVVAIPGGITGPDDLSRDFEPQIMPPWKPETLDYVMHHKLQIHNFRGELKGIA